MDAAQYAGVVGAGVPAGLLTLVADCTALPLERVARFLGLPKATLFRKLKQGPDVCLGLGEGDAAADLGRFIGLVQLGAGQGQPALSAAGRSLGQWLEQPQPTLGGLVPGVILHCGVGRAEALLLLKRDLSRGRL